jgi:hypothetical protein
MRCSIKKAGAEWLSSSIDATRQCGDITILQAERWAVNVANDRYRWYILKR